MELQNRHLNAIRRFRPFREHLIGLLPGLKLLTRRLETLSEGERGLVHDICLELWKYRAPCVHERMRTAGDEAYPHQVRGIRGAYFIQAFECDPIGPFDTKEAAIEELKNAYLD